MCSSDLEAKIQMGKKLPGEEVLVFIEEKLEILPTEQTRKSIQKFAEPEISPLEKWKWLFFGKK